MLFPRKGFGARPLSPIQQPYPAWRHVGIGVEMSKQIRKLCGEITALAVGIEKNDVFVSYHPHSKLLVVETHFGGWKADGNSDKDVWIWLSGSASGGEDVVIENLNGIKAKLEALLS